MPGIRYLCLLGKIKTHNVCKITSCFVYTPFLVYGKIPQGVAPTQTLKSVGIFGLLWPPQQKIFQVVASGVDNVVMHSINSIVNNFVEP